VKNAVNFNCPNYFGRLSTALKGVKLITSK
jgi:hypothetical protein